MAEITRIITAEITCIGKGIDEMQGAVATEEQKQVWAKDIANRLDADNVVITKVQHFVRDEEEIKE